MTVLFRARGDHESEETPTNETVIYVETFCYEIVLSMECDILNVNFTNCIDFHSESLIFVHFTPILLLGSTGYLLVKASTSGFFPKPSRP